MTEQEFTQKLLDILEEFSHMNEEDRYETGFYLEGWLEDSKLQNFDTAGLLTNDYGVVIKLQSGEEFQLTIIKSS